MTGLLSYYKSSDKRTPTNSGDTEHTSQAVILSPVLGISRNSQLLNIATGLPLAGVVTRVPGPDNPSGLGAIYTGLGVSKINMLCPIISPCDFTITFWFQMTAPNQQAVVLQGGVNNINIQVIAGTIYVIAEPSATVILSFPYDVLWHFIKISYDHVTGIILASVDNGADTSTPGSLFSTILINTIMIWVNSNCPFFDLRIFSTVIANANLTYYYNDVLAGGNRTLSQA
jgi:hypothetical protein